MTCHQSPRLLIRKVKQAAKGNKVELSKISNFARYGRGKERREKKGGDAPLSVMEKKRISFSQYTKKTAGGERIYLHREKKGKE